MTEAQAEAQAEADSFVPLTPAQAAVLRPTLAQVSPWRITAAQAVLGLVLAALAWGVSGRASIAWSVLYGAATVVLPGALMARGMRSRPGVVNAGSLAVRFMSWELVKIGVSVVLLLLAPKLVASLSWLALLLAMVLCMKINWLALLWRGRATTNA